jgi:nucleoside-diphosphate-sugar epimerase
MEQAARMDRLAIETIGTALEGTDRPFVVASGTLGLAPGQLASERTTHGAVAHPRVAGANLALSFAEQGVRSSIVRFAPTVHGPGDHGFMAVLVAIARRTGVSGYIEDGASRWPAVHRLDAGNLVALAVSGAPAGSVLHAVAEEGVPTRAIAEAIGKGLGVPTASIPADRATEHFDWLGRFFGLDSPASNTLTRQLLGWQPTHPGLIDDLTEGYYFQPTD